MYEVTTRDAIRAWVLVQGPSQRSAAKQLGVSRDTVARLLGHGFAFVAREDLPTLAVVQVARGGMPDHRILFRGGIYEGARSSQAGELPTCAGNQQPPACRPAADPVINPNGVPLLAGMVRLNLIGDEITYPGYPGIYLDGKSRVSVGVGGQWQSKGAVGGLVPGATAYPDYVVLAADTFIDLALAGDTEAVFGLNGYRFDYGSGNARTGLGASGEVGYRIGKIEPQVNVYWFNSDTKANSSVRWAAGMNYFFKGHAAKIGAEFAGQIVNGRLSATADGSLNATPTLHQIIVQGQLFF